jgi:hypothetical protein
LAIPEFLLRIDEDDGHRRRARGRDGFELHAPRQAAALVAGEDLQIRLRRTRQGVVPAQVEDGLGPEHGNADTLKAVVQPDTVIVAPQAVRDALPAELQAVTQVLANGETASVAGIGVEAIPMYNLTAERLQYHAKGRGNGYVLTMGGKRVYIAGDTEDIPEMRQLRDIDVAFVPMNLPFTMTVAQAADAVRDWY